MAYFWLNAAGYLGLAACCTLRHAKVSASQGFVTLDASGRVEYLTLYGGLQMGLGAFYVVLATNPIYHQVGLLFSLLLYGGIVLVRVLSIGLFWPVSSLTRVLAVSEALLLLAAVVLLARRPV